MKQKTGRKLLSFILTLAMVVGLMPGMGLTAYAAGEHDHSKWSAWTSDYELPDEAGSYYLTQDVTLDGDTWEVPEGVTNLCLNGHGVRIDGGFEVTVIKVKSGATLNLYECNTQTVHKYTVDDDGFTTMNDEASGEGVRIFTGGYITGGDDGGVYVDNEGTLNMYGGTIIGNYGYDGGVILWGGTFTMSGGTITGNSAYYGGGVYVHNGGTFTMTGGTITGNTALNGGGGVDVYSGTLNLSGSPTITGNTLEGNANNVCLEDGNITLTGALTNTTPIGVTMGTPGVFSSSTGDVKAKDYAANFTSDNDTYTVAADGNELKLVLHTHSVTITAGDHMTKTAGSGDAEQTGLTGAMADVVYTADDGYYFPTNYSVAEVSGISVTRDSYTQITVSGTPTADAAITLTAPTAKDDITMTTTPAAVSGLVYSGESQTLITAGVPSFGTVVYSLDGESFSDVLPQAINAGTYTVYYKVDGDESHNAFAAQTLSVTIATDKTALNNAITGAETYYNSIKDSNPAVAATLKDAIDAAKSVKDNAGATQEQVDNALTALNGAKGTAEAAVLTETKNELSDAVAGAQTYYESIKDSNPAVAATLKDAIDAAKAVKDNAGATQEQVDNALTALNGAKGTAEAAVLTETKNELSDAVAGAQTYYDSIKDSNPAVAATLKDAIDAAKAVKDNAGATQEQVDNAAKALAGAKTLAETAAAINALPDFSNVTADNKASIEAARAAYDALTAEQKNGVSAETLKRLTDAEDKLVILQAMSEVSAKTGSGMTYTGSPIQLINTPTTALPAGYAMKYAVTTENKAPTDESLYTTSVPTATDAGTYYVWCKAAGGAGHADTEPACVTATIARPVPAPAVIVARVSRPSTKVSASKGTMVVSWKATAGAKSYQVQWRKAGASKWTTKTVRGRTYTIKGLRRGAAYQVRVRGVGGKAKGDWSKAASRWLKAATKVKVSAGKKSGTIKVRWARDAKATAGCRVYVYAKRGGKAVKAVEVAKGKVSATVRGLKAGKAYFVRVRPYRRTSGVIYTGTASGYRTARAAK